jgi:hypothetical protein
MGIGYVRAGLCYGGPGMVPEQQRTSLHAVRLLARAFRQHQTASDSSQTRCGHGMQTEARAVVGAAVARHRASCKLPAVCSGGGGRENE